MDSIFEDVHEFDQIAEAFKIAHRHGMEVEFIYALYTELRKNPEKPLGQALTHALYEWDLI